jgi:hypothetical protein
MSCLVFVPWLRSAPYISLSAAEQATCTTVGDVADCIVGNGGGLPGAKYPLRLVRGGVPLQNTAPVSAGFFVGGNLRLSAMYRRQRWKLTVANHRACKTTMQLLVHLKVELTDKFGLRYMAVARPTGTSLDIFTQCAGPINIESTFTALSAFATAAVSPATARDCAEVTAMDGARVYDADADAGGDVAVLPVQSLNVLRASRAFTAYHCPSCDDLHCTPCFVCVPAIRTTCDWSDGPPLVACQKAVNTTIAKVSIKLFLDGQKKMPKWRKAQLQLATEYLASAQRLLEAIAQELHADHFDSMHGELLRVRASLLEAEQAQPRNQSIARLFNDTKPTKQTSMTLTPRGNDVDTLLAKFDGRLRNNRMANTYWLRFEAVVCIGCGHTICRSCRRGHVCTAKHLVPGVGFVYDVDVLHIETPLDGPCIKVEDYVTTAECSVRLHPDTPELVRVDPPVQTVSSFDFFKTMASEALSSVGEYMELRTTTGDRRHHYLAVYGIKRLFMSVKDLLVARPSVCTEYLATQKVVACKSRTL